MRLSYLTKQTTGKVCILHKYHYPRPARPTEAHHIRPKYMGGLSVPENMADICPTGHDDVHLYITWLVANDATYHKSTAERAGILFNYADWAVASRSKPEPSVTRSEKALAIRGFSEWAAAGRPALLDEEAA